MTNETLIKLPWKLERDAPFFEGNDIKHPEELTRYILKKYSKRGDKILDPFAGLGTSLFIAEEMKRIPFGIESERQKYEWVAGQMENWTHMAHDDAANILKYNWPKIDLIVTSPPFMARQEKANPLHDGDPKKSGYDQYLKRMRYIFAKLANTLKKNGRLVLQVNNFHQGKVFTPLTHDLAVCLSGHFTQVDEITVIWDNPKPNYPATQLMVFKKI